jgi:phenylalanyl-tRNA synthetase alpha chain
MEGVRMFTDEDFANSNAKTTEEKLKMVEDDLKHGLGGMARELFGNVEMRWVDASFPFTEPSFELEIYFNDEWLEVLGCGVVHKDIVTAVGRGDQLGWAFGLGLERLAMVLFSIPDIRLFWTQDDRFHSQFESGEIIKFQHYSKYPPCFKDISFWTSKEGVESTFHPNDIYEVVRDVAGDLVERVELIDEFAHPKSNRLSNCFRITYRSMDRSLTNEEIDSLQGKVRDDTISKLGVELR